MANTMSKYGSNTNRPLSEIVGLSTDTKPTDSIEGIQIQNGSSFRELDTGKRFLFDAENTTWNEVSSGGGGGSTLIEKSISANGVYNASEDSADGYSKVSVDVPNTYTAQDEGKVVDNGALVAQTAMSSEVTENGTVDTTLYNSVTVNVPSGGGTSQPRKDVNFYDYDGTIVNSYTAAEFANLSELPANPTHDGLTAQGWNWSLADAKTYVASYGKLEIGQMYVTSDGKTRLYITLTEGRTSPTLSLDVNTNSELDIDWGDGSAHSTFTPNRHSEIHNYASIGDYVIVITVISGSFVLQSSQTTFSTILWAGSSNSQSPNIGYNNSIKKLEVGTNASIGNNAFYGCYSLQSITIPNSVTSIGNSVFFTCYSLQSITIPNSVTSIGEYMLKDCYSLNNLSLPKSLTSIGTEVFNGCRSISLINIPDLISDIQSRTICNCDSLIDVIVPNSVTDIASNAISSCPSLSSIKIPNSVTSIGNNAFRYNYSLATITIDKPEGSISGSPWGASTSSPTSTQIIWTG